MTTNIMILRPNHVRNDVGLKLMPLSRLFIFTIYNLGDLAMIQKSKEKQRHQNKVTDVSFLRKIEGGKLVLYYEAITQ